MITADILGERSRLTPEKTALVYVPTQERFTYRELNERAVRCGRMLLEGCGLKKGDRVGILAHNRVEFLEVFFAAGKTGLVLVPLNTRLTPHELGFIVRDCALSALLYGGEFSETIEALKEEIHLNHWLSLDEPLNRLDTSYGRAIGAMGPSAWVGPPCDPEDLYCLLYTSGTTGKPKGVMIPHRMVAWNGYNTAVSWQLREEDVAPIFTPLFHAGGLGVFLVPLFVMGGTIVLHRGFEASEVWRTIEKEKCTVVFGVPTIFKMLMEAPEFSQVDLAHVRWFISGGAPLPLYIFEAYQRRGIIFKQGYGLTEVGVNCFSMTLEESIRRVGSVGKPMMLTEARLVDPQGRTTSVGEVGELLLRGPHVSPGYWNNPAATAAALDPEGWFHTSDLARRDEEGFYYIAGRMKDMIISGGVNIYPAEIEGELLLHPEIKDAAVIGVPDPTWGEVSVAFLVGREGCTVSKEELSRFLSNRLAKYKIPREFIYTKALPRTPYGKVVKSELKEQYLKDRDEKSLSH
ncbi:MAG: long-chain fatty acid--CoA ligase [Acidobacteriia bacterium]|nr:long-chain fatty acid--CoA ligase [Terriglobia bacterium]